MASNVHSGNDAETDFSATVAVEKERTIEPEEAPEKEAKPVADHPTVAEATILKKERPGCPEYCVFRVIVPVLGVESIIGKNGDVIKKMCQDTKAHISVLEGPVSHPDRIVLISGKKETEPPLSPAMDAVIRVFKRVNGFPENENDGVNASIPFCSIRLLVPSMQATSLIEKQGSTLNTIKENTCSVRILSIDEVSALSANSDDRVVSLYGEALKVLQALEAILRHLHKFLVDDSLLPLFEKTRVERWSKSGNDGDFSDQARMLPPLSGQPSASTRPSKPPPRNRRRRRLKATSTHLHKAMATQEKHQGAIVHTDTQPQRESLFPDRGPHQFSPSEVDPTRSRGFDRMTGPRLTQAKTGAGGGPARPFAPSSSSSSNHLRSSSSPLFGFASSSMPFASAPSPTFGFGSSSSCTSLSAPTYTFGTSCCNLFGGASTTTTTTTTTPLFSRLSSSSPTPTPTSFPTTTFSFGNPTTSTGLQASSTASTTRVTTFGPVTSSSLPIFPTPTTTTSAGPSTSFLGGFQTPAASSLFGETSLEEIIRVPPKLPRVQPATACVSIETKRSRSVFEEELLGVFKRIADNMNKQEQSSKPTFEDCEKKLNELGWPQNDPLHKVALAIFCGKSDNYRECWMKLNPERCANWVRVIGRSQNML